MLESTTLRSEGRVDFPMQDEDPDAMLIIMHIIHGRTHQVPRSVSLDLLTKIATSVDYLECLDLIEPFADGWINALKKGAAATYSKALIQWLCVSLIFRKENLFAALTRTAIRQAKGPIQTLGLPIRDSIVGEFLPLIPPKKSAYTHVKLSEKINQTRHRELERVFSNLDEALKHFRKIHATCIIERNCMYYGLLMEALESCGSLYPHPQIPFLGLCCEDLIQSGSRIRAPHWRDASTDHDYNLRVFIQRLIRGVDNDIKGLSLSDFIQS